MATPEAGSGPDDTLARWRSRADIALAAALDGLEGRTEPRLLAAMRHAVLLGGKRMRPLLAYAAGHACGAREEQLDGAAAAVELVHAYSLVHDDLPAMDDDALRRGRPTVHVAFDEATAILAGDALQALAFTTLARAPAAAALRVAWLDALADATGAGGMCGGQALDMDATGQSLAYPELQRLHALKTGALIRCAVRCGALAGNADPALLYRLDDYADALGVAFQIRDDILDVEGDSAQLGKTAGKDQAQAKSTYPALLGMDGAKQRLAQMAEKTKAALGPLDGRADGLRRLAEFAVARIS